jgi:hypothetical protein
MARTATRRFDPEFEQHKAWMGLVQPVGLVVAIPALLKAQVFPDKAIAAVQQTLHEVVQRPGAGFGDPDPVLSDFPRFASAVLGWSVDDLAGAPGGPALPEPLAVHLPDDGETLRPTYAVVDGMANGQVLMLVLEASAAADLDKPPADIRHGWHASPQARLERLLRETGVVAGLLTNGEELRLVHAPRGESSGHIGFPIAEMCTVGGRPILAALHMLLGEHRLLGAPDGQRLLDVMAESRKYQSEVSTRLSGQVLEALWDLLRGFQAADDAAGGRVLHDLPRTDPQQIYGGLLTVIMRLVFLLYAEDQGLMPDSPVYARNYAIGGLHERLREDAGRYPDTMDQRYGAWAWLLATFRLVFDGGGHGAMRLPARHGQLFNPDEYPFLEGRPPGVGRVMVGETFKAPRVSDGVIHRVLEALLVLDGERLSYRALDVEQIGSVYESMMGFEVRSSPGRAVAVTPKHVVVDLDALLEVPGARRGAWLKEQAECDVPASAAAPLKAATTVDELVAALGRRVSPQTPHPLPPGALFLQPGEERRRSGSHYTPRELTAPIVRTALRPVLEALGPRPTPAQLLDLKVCDPAMGSGAFLVEACRQLAEALVQAWEAHDCTPKLPPDEDPLLHARRLVAQRCLYGVDKNRFAVNLARLSLWLVTLARDHAFTFLDHALKHGDSLVGLTTAQIGAFHWRTIESAPRPLFDLVASAVHDAAHWRQQLHARDEGDYDQRLAAWREAEDALHGARLAGDACIAAYFGADKDAERETLLRAHRYTAEASAAGCGDSASLAAIVDVLRAGERSVTPFHWALEFPEIFGRANPGFDVMVGNPPFLGGRKMKEVFGERFQAWLQRQYPHSSANADLCAFFLLRCFDLLRARGTCGVIATDTIAQGDSRSTGLRWLSDSGAAIYEARKRYKWPGVANVVVSVVHLFKGIYLNPKILDRRPVERITAFLLAKGGDGDPRALAVNIGKSYQGSIVLGMGFTFDDSGPADDETPGVPMPLSTMKRLISAEHRNSEVIFPYIGGEEVNSNPTQAHHRYVVDFRDRSEDECWLGWPEVMELIEKKVKPERTRRHANGNFVLRSPLPQRWWHHADKRPALYAAIAENKLVLACPGGTGATKHIALALLPVGTVFSQTLCVFPLEGFDCFSVLQSRVHEVWAFFNGATLGDGLRYNSTSCFDTFPFPGEINFAKVEQAVFSAVNDSALNIGANYYEFRAGLMRKNKQGFTATYNRFHDPDEKDGGILELRQLHGEMDEAVLAAYGWSDVPTRCGFGLDYLDLEDGVILPAALQQRIDEGELFFWDAREASAFQQQFQAVTGSRRRLPWRYRWPEAVRDDVLARLLDLNQARYEAEVAAGLHGQATSPTRKAKAPAKKAAPTPRRAASNVGALTLFGDPAGGNDA